MNAPDAPPPVIPPPVIPPPDAAPPDAAPSIASRARDNARLWGMFGLALSFCCLPLGVVFAALSLTEAKKAGIRPILAYASFAAAAAVLVTYIILWPR